MSEEKKETKPEAYPMPAPIVVENKMYDIPQKAPDGHVNLSAEDIKKRA